MKAFALEHETLIKKAATVYSGVSTLNSLVFYLHRPVVIDADVNSLCRKLRESRPLVCFMPEKKYVSYRGKLSGFFVAERYGKVLLSNIVDPHGQPGL